ncbi:MAG: HDOD domain-containing protein [Deltaproteobacteria bacterium]|nr:HDOD domain-containing protein [Candidatus Anaeroferrophillacea bacterium]
MRANFSTTAAASGFRDFLAADNPLPRLSSVLQEVIACGQDPDTNADRLARLVTGDAALSARILKTVNAAYYGFSGEISSIRHAIVLIGFGEVVNLAVGLAFIGIMLPDSDDTFYRHFRDHSLATANLALFMAEKLALRERSTIFTGGLLHDLGRLLLYAWQPETYRRIMAGSVQRQQSPLILEHELLGIDHPTAGSLAGTYWHLPESLTAPMGTHHALLPEPCGFPLTGLIRLADIIAARAGYPAIPGAPPPRLPSAVWTHLQRTWPHISRDRLKLWQEELRPGIDQLKELPGQAPSPGRIPHDNPEPH